MYHDLDQLRTQYEERKQNLEFLVGEIRYSLSQELSRNKIKYHSLIHRIKEFDSFADKIRRKDVKEPFNEIHDLVGLRVVCLFLSDIEVIGEMIQNKFDVFEIDNKIDGVNTDVFGYMSVQHKAKLRESTFDSEHNDARSYPFEIQVRTIAQDAWASISHHLDYKQDNLFSDTLKRDFHALSGLFYVADTHFLLLKNEQSKYFIEKSSAQQITRADG